MVLEGRAIYAQIPAHDGQLGVAADRAAMLVKMGIGKLRLEIDGSPDKGCLYVLDGGFAQMHGNKLTLISERAIDVAELSSETARDALSKAEALPQANSEQLAKRDHDMAMARAMMAAVGATGAVA